MAHARRIVFVLAALALAGARSAPGQEDAAGAALRFIESGGTDSEALSAVEKAGDAGLDAVRAIAAEGRRYADAPKGIVDGSTKLTLDKSFEVKYRLYVPDSYKPSTPIPMLLYVHGTFSSGGEALRSVLPSFRDRGMLVLCPSSEISGRGWTSTRYERMMQIDAIEHVRAKYNVDWSRIYVGGYSRGGHASWDLPMHHPGVFAASFPLAGGPRLAGIRFLENYLHTALHAEWGAEDEKGMVWCDREAAARLRTLGYACSLTERPGTGHLFSPDYPAIAEWLASAKRPVAPQRVVIAAEIADEGQAFWIRMIDLDRKKAEMPAAKKGKLVLGGKEVEVVVGGVETPKGFDARPEEERWRFFVDKALQYRALIDAEAGRDNVVRVKSENVKSFAVLVSEPMFDLSNPIEVVVNGRSAFKARVKPSASYMLRRLAESSDWSVAYSNEIKVVVK